MPWFIRSPCLQYDDQIADPLKVNVYGDGNPAAAKAAAPAARGQTTKGPTLPPAPEPIILNRRDRRKLKDTPGVGADGAVPVMPPPPPAPAPTQQTKAMIHQQMAEMKRYVSC